VVRVRRDMLHAKAIEGEAAHGRVTTGEEPLALRQVVDHVHHRTSLIVLADDGAGKTGGQSETRTAGEHQPARMRHQSEYLRGEKGFREPDLRCDRARRELAVRAQIRARSGIDLIVAAVADERLGKRREPHLRKQTADVELILLTDVLVEEAHAL